MKRIFSFANYGYELFVKRLFLNLVLIIEIVISIVAINFSIATVTGLYADVSVIESVAEDSLFVMPSRELANSKNGEYLDFSDIKGDYTVGKGYKTFLKTKFQNSGLIMYSGEILNNMNIPLSKGKWDAPVINEGGILYYPIVVSRESEVNLGEKFDATTDKESLHCYVSGILGDEQQYLELSSASNVATAQQLIKKCDRELMLFCNADFLSPDFFDYKSVCNNRVLFFENTASNDISYNKGVLREQAFVFEKEEIIQNSISKIKDSTRYYTVICISLLIVSVTGLLSCSFVSLYKNASFYKTAVLCGAKRRDCIVISAINFLWICLMSLGLLSIIWCFVIYSDFKKKYDLCFSGWNVLVTSIVYITVILLGCFIPLLFFSKRKSEKIILNKEVIGVYND